MNVLAHDRMRPAGVRSRVWRNSARVIRHYWLALIIFLAFMGLWEALTRLLNVPRYVLPSVSAILSAMNVDRDNLIAQTGVTLQEIALGFVCGVAAGMLLAVAMAHSKTLERGLYPIIIASQAVPVPAIASPLVIWLGYNILPKVVVIVLIVFFPIVVNEFVGLTGVDPELLNLMRSMSASRWKVFWNVRFPSSLPFLFAGAKLAATYSVIGAVFGEWVGSDQGLGAYLLQQNANLRIDRVFADIFVLSALGVLLFILTGVVEYFTTPWRHRTTK
ncbi:MAG TPA: ABC transporter permease [Chloroflexota bacterium]|nr:ABC transporter permease [Chloroflexota bacterium]